MVRTCRMHGRTASRHKSLVEKTEVKEPLGGLRRRLQGKNKIAIKDAISYLIELAQDLVHGTVPTNTVRN